MRGESSPTSVVAPWWSGQRKIQNASVIVRFGLSEKIKERTDATQHSQNSTTIRNPSRDFSSPFSLRFGHQSIEPMARATKGLGKARPAPSR
ncbi:hypothetical protein DMI65_02850 [Escherichia coli]|nr:hypothetical protein [Escherichia coli]